MHKVFFPLVLAGFLSAGTAHADGDLSVGEEVLGDRISGGVCEFIDQQGITVSSMLELFEVVYRQPAVFTPGDAADVVNYVVYNYCPVHWKELVAFGEGVRA